MTTPKKQTAVLLLTGASRASAAQARVTAPPGAMATRPGKRRRRSPVRALGCWLAYAFAGSAGAAPAVPPAWAQYSTALQSDLTTRMMGSTPAAVRLRADLPPLGQDTSPPILLSLWINPRGQVTRLDVVASTVTANDLRAVVQQAPVQRPPRDLLLPVRLAIHVSPPPPTAADTAGPPASPAAR
jgi:hypothetical protein